ncbi:unnamed protein product, partial [Ectocarpus sp. 8 AP-2014]
WLLPFQLVNVCHTGSVTQVDLDSGRRPSKGESPVKHIPSHDHTRWVFIYRPPKEYEVFCKGSCCSLSVWG